MSSLISFRKFKKKKKYVLQQHSSNYTTKQAAELTNLASGMSFQNIILLKMCGQSQ